MYSGLDKATKALEDQIQAQTGLSPKLLAEEGAAGEYRYRPYVEAGFEMSHSSDSLAEWKAKNTPGAVKWCQAGKLENVNCHPSSSVPNSSSFDGWVLLGADWLSGLRIARKYFSACQASRTAYFPRKTEGECGVNVDIAGHSLENYQVYNCPNNMGVDAAILPEGEDGTPKCPLGGTQTIREVGSYKAVYSPFNPNCSEGAGNPCQIATGNKQQTEIDIQLPGPLPITFKRFYNSIATNHSSGNMGKNWRHTYSSSVKHQDVFKIDKSIPAPESELFVTKEKACIAGWESNKNKVYGGLLSSASASYSQGNDCGIYLNNRKVHSVKIADIQQVPTNQNHESVLRVINDAGQEKRFQLSNQWQSEYPGQTQLTKENGLWKVQKGSTDIATFYDTQGRLKKRTQNTAEQTFFYEVSIADGGDGNPDTLDKITDNVGHELKLKYNADKLLTHLHFNNKQIQYGYDSNKRLVSVTYADGNTKQYVYENSNLPNHLTGIIDENNVHYATWTYHADGRVKSSEHAGGAEKVSFDYQSNGSTTTTDASGSTRTYDFQIVKGSKRIKSISGQRCVTCNHAGFKSKTYNDKGLLETETDWNGAITRYEYHANDLVSQKTLAFGTANAQVTSYVWDANLRLPTQITRGKLKETITYNAQGLRLSSTLTDLDTNVSRVTTYTYNAAGFLQSIDGPLSGESDKTLFVTNAKGQVTEVINALGHKTQITAYNAFGQPLTIIDANGTATTLTYDARQRLTQMKKQGVQIDYAYDKVGQLTTLTHNNGTVLNYFYDDAHRLIKVTNQLGESIHYTVDASGNTTQTQIKNAQNAIVKQQQAIFNQVGEMTKQLGANGQSTTVTYDNNGNPLTTIDALSQKSTQTFDALNRLKQSIDPLGGQTQYGYDNQGNLNSVIDANSKQTTYQFNAFGEVMTQTSPDTGTTRFTYDLAGNPLSKTDAMNNTVNYVYDGLSRLTQITYSDSSLNQTFSYDGTTNNNFGLGRLTKVTQNSGTVNYQYDGLGNLITETKVQHQQTFITQYNYNATGQMTGMTYPSGAKVNYVLDSSGRINKVTLVKDGQTTVLANNVNYLPFGPSTGWIYGNGMNQVNQFDTDYRLTQTKVMNQSNAILNQQYTYSLNNNVTISNGTSAQSFEYDKLSRLTKANGSYGGIEFTYDSVGNRNLKTTTDNIGTYTYASDSARLTQHETKPNTTAINLQDKLIEEWNFDNAIPENTPFPPSGLLPIIWGNEGDVSKKASQLLSGKAVNVINFRGQYYGADGAALPNHSSLHITKGTVTAWIKTASSDSKWRAIVGDHGAWALYIKSGKLVLWDYQTSQGIYTNIAVNNNQWRQVAVVLDSGVTNGTKLYVDGEPVFTTTYHIANAYNEWQVGNDYRGRYETFTGDIYEVAIYSSLYSDSQIKSLFTNENTGSDLLALVNANLTMTDNVKNTSNQRSTNYSGGMKLVVEKTPQDKNNLSLKVNNDAKSFMSLGNGSQFHTNQITLEVSFKTTGKSGDSTILNKYAAWHISLRNNQLFLENHQTGAISLAGPTLNDNQWHHVALSIDNGVNNGTKLYLDGKLILTTTHHIATQGFIVSVGSGAVSTSNIWAPFSGQIDNVAFYKTILTPAEISARYRVIKNQYTASEPPKIVHYAYNANGSLTAKDNQVFTYNEAGRLSAFQTPTHNASYQHNHKGERIRKILNGVTTDYHYNLNGLLIAESDNSQQHSKEYIYLNGRPLAQIINNQVYYYHNDHLGSPQVLTNSQKHVVWQASYTPFGKATITTNTIENNLRFPGQYFDSESGLHYNYFRDYDPEAGRYIQSDPIGLAGGMNTYAYVSGNPINRIDPLGLKECECGHPPTKESLDRRQAILLAVTGLSGNANISPLTAMEALVYTQSAAMGPQSEAGALVVAGDIAIGGWLLIISGPEGWAAWAAAAAYNAAGYQWAGSQNGRIYTEGNTYVENYYTHDSHSWIETLELDANGNLINNWITGANQCQ